MNKIIINSCNFFKTFTKHKRNCFYQLAYSCLTGGHINVRYQSWYVKLNPPNRQLRSWNQKRWNRWKNYAFTEIIKRLFHFTDQLKQQWNYGVDKSTDPHKIMGHTRLLISFRNSWWKCHRTPSINWVWSIVYTKYTPDMSSIMYFCGRIIISLWIQIAHSPIFYGFVSLVFGQSYRWLAPDGGSSIANALGLSQSCAKTSIFFLRFQ